MPMNDGTGNRGQGRGARRGAGFDRTQGNVGSDTAGSWAGPGGYCICPACQTKMPHQQGIPCYSLTCPKCGAAMVRGQ
ncbi:MAG: hypothetical protein ACOYEJ_02780 [Mahellales bacterium]|jgi:hypothetical protein